MKKILVFLAVVSLLAPISVNAQSTLALQEKCAEGAKKFFFNSEKVKPFVSSDRELGFWFDDSGWGTTEYISHYNKKLDKCFIFIVTDYHRTWISRSKNIGVKPEDLILHDSLVLFDVFEERRIAVIEQSNSELGIFGCWVENKKCKSRSEFEALIKPYMEE